MLTNFNFRKKWLPPPLWKFAQNNKMTDKSQTKKNAEKRFKVSFKITVICCTFIEFAKF